MRAEQARPSRQGAQQKAIVEARQTEHRRTDDPGPVIETVNTAASGRIYALAAGYYDPMLAAISTMILRGHTDGISRMVMSADGILATGSGDHTVRLWNAVNGWLLNTLDGHEPFVSALAFRPDGSVLATAHNGMKDAPLIRLWRPLDGKLLATLAKHVYTVDSLAISSDGQVLASGSLDTTVRLWSLPDGAYMGMLPGHTGEARVGYVAFSPDGRLLASAGTDNSQVVGCP